MNIVIPNLGDGIESAVVISILVKPGDTVSVDQTLFELETDKAVAPVDSVAAGVVESIAIKDGDTVSEGQVVGVLSSSDDSASPAAQTPAAPVAAAAPVAVVEPSAAAVAPVVSAAVTAVQGTAQMHSPNSVASISIEQLAYRIGLDLRYVKGSGQAGRILEADLVNHIAFLQSLMLQPPASAVAPVVAEPAAPKLPDFTKWGEVSIEKCSPLRKKIAEKMVQSWQSVPHVTQQLEIEITHVMQLRKKYNPTYIKKDAKLTLTVFAIRAIQKALELFPQFNATYDEVANELIKKKYFHMGIAVDTENGLIVPVIKNVDQKSLFELSQELTVIANKAKDRSLSVDELQGGTFTISNLGGLGVGAFTPIVNTPEVAILGIGTGELKPVVDKKKKVDYVLKMPVCLSYDHRIIDGADGARFVMEIKNQFETFAESELKEI